MFSQNMPWYAKYFGNLVIVVIFRGGGGGGVKVILSNVVRIGPVMSFSKN